MNPEITLQQAGTAMQFGLHRSKHLLAIGFASGTIRVFDITCLLGVGMVFSPARRLHAVQQTSWWPACRPTQPRFSPLPSTRPDASAPRLHHWSDDALCIVECHEGPQVVALWDPQTWTKKRLLSVQTPLVDVCSLGAPTSPLSPLSIPPLSCFAPRCRDPLSSSVHCRSVQRLALHPPSPSPSFPLGRLHALSLHNLLAPPFSSISPSPLSLPRLPLLQVSFSPSGRFLVTAFTDWTVWLWNSATLTLHAKALLPIPALPRDESARLSFSFLPRFPGSLIPVLRTRLTMMRALFPCVQTAHVHNPMWRSLGGRTQSLVWRYLVMNASSSREKGRRGLLSHATA